MNTNHDYYNHVPCSISFAPRNFMASKPNYCDGKGTIIRDGEEQECYFCDGSGETEEEGEG